MAPVGNVPAASPSTYIESGTVASEMFGASVAPTIEPVAKITAEFAPVSACAAASRTTLDRARTSSALSSVALRSIIGISAHWARPGFVDFPALWRGQARRSTDANGRTPCADVNLIRSLEYQDQIVGRHRHDFAQREPNAPGQLLDIDDVAHAPFGVLLAQTGVEQGIAERGMLAVALERSIEEQPAVIVQMARRAGKQPLRHAPRRNVDDIGAEDRQQFAWTARSGKPVWVRKVDPQRRPDVGEVRLRAPCRDARQMLRAEIARPPGDIGGLAGEGDDMLAGAAAG